MADEFTPTTGEVRALYVVGVMKVSGPQFGGAAPAEFERMIARVRRDAAREALDGFERKCDEIADRFRADGPEISVRQRERAAEFAAIYRDTHYPETED